MLLGGYSMKKWLIALMVLTLAFLLNPLGDDSNNSLGQTEIMQQAGEPYCC